MLISHFLFISVFYLTVPEVTRAEVIGTPRIECKPDGIHFFANMSNPFSGRIYLKGHSATNGCFKDYFQQPTTQLTSIFDFDHCHMRRKREMLPAAMRIQSRVIISHHPKVETYQDVAYDIDCIYQVHDELATAAQKLKIISDSPPEEMKMEPSPPKCSYQIEIGNITETPGEIISTVAVGDTVTHVWNCDEGSSNNYTMYCIRVHDCVARGEDSSEITVVDQYGCVTEPELLSPLQHSSSYTRVSATSRVFKFPNSTGISFDCQISFSLRIHEENKTCPSSQCVRLRRPKRSAINGDLEVESQQLTVLEDQREFISPLRVQQCHWINGPLLIVSTSFFVYLFFTVFVWLTPARREL